MICRCRQIIDHFVDLNKIDHPGGSTVMDDHFAALGIMV
jgi:hypothetical protein